MALVTIDQARSEMVLAADVLDRRGRLLIPAGRALAEKHVDALRMWGIEQIEIEGDHERDECEPTLDPEAVARAGAEVDELFRNAGEGHPFLAGLRRLATERKALADARLGEGDAQ